MKGMKLLHIQTTIWAFFLEVRGPIERHIIPILLRLRKSYTSLKKELAPNHGLGLLKTAILDKLKTVMAPEHHYSEVIMRAMASRVFAQPSVQRKDQSSTSLAFVRGIHPWLVDSPHKGPATWQIFQFDDVIMILNHPDDAGGSTHIWNVPQNNED